MKTKQNLELRIGQVEINTKQLVLEGEDKNYLWNPSEKSYKYSPNNKNHRYVLYKENPENILFYLANNCESSSKVAKRFSLNTQNLIAGGRLYPLRPFSLKNLILISDCYECGSFIPTKIARNCATSFKENLIQQNFNVTNIKINSKLFGSVNKFWIENGFLPSQVRKRKLTIEKAGKLIEDILQRAEQGFMSEHARLPSLYLESDYEKFANFLDIPLEIKKYSHLEKPDSEDKLYHIYHSITGHDIAYSLIKRFLQREEYFKDKSIIDTIFGTVDYRAPKREFELRIKSLNELISKGIVISNDEWDKVTNSLNVIKKRCFLPRTTRRLMKENPKNTTLKRPGYENIGTHMVNPVSEMFNTVEFITSLEEIVHKYKDHGYLGKMAYYL